MIVRENYRSSEDNNSEIVCNKFAKFLLLLRRDEIAIYYKSIFVAMDGERFNESMGLC